MDRHVTPENPFGVIGEVASAVTALQSKKVTKQRIYGFFIFKEYDSLRSWRYCVGARLKFLRRSRVPKKGSRDEAVGGISRGFAARDGCAVKSHSTILQRLRRQISLNYYTIPPATQARNMIADTEFHCE